MAAELLEVGVVAELNVFPVKSMRGVQTEAAHLGWQGFEGDRRYAFVRTGSLNGLPWVSARQVPALVTYRAELTDDRGGVTVTAPDGRRMPVRADGLAEEIAARLGAPVHLMHLHRGAFDAMSVSIITRRSILSLGEGIGQRLESERFRANVVIDTDVARAYPEEKWVSRALVFGEGTDPARVRVNRRDDRCSIVDLNPVTGIRDVAAHRAIVAVRRNALGVYGTPERTGPIRVGDRVWLRRS
jgi:uncharacterized protein YcbX